MQNLKVNLPEAFEELENQWRYKVMWGGRGSAKSWTVAIKLILLAVQRPTRILCTRELQKSIKQSVHKLLSDQIHRLGLTAFFDIQQQGIYGKNGSEFIFFGVKHNADEIKSTEGVDICWIEEGHSLSPDSWDIIDPTIRAEGSEIWITYNTRFKFDHLHQMFVVNAPPDNAWVANINHGDNPHFPDVLRKQMEDMKIKDYEKYLHIWEGQLKTLANGAVFGNEVTATKRDKRLIHIPVVSNCEVHTFWDLGNSDNTAIWFMQRAGGQYRFIDYYANRLQPIDHYVKVIKSMGYNYGTHYMPHDADHQRLGMVGSMREQFERGGIRPIQIVPRTSDKETAISQARTIFAECWFHIGTDERGQRIENGWEALCNYRYKYNEENDVYGKKPHHDWASNGADAFMQMGQHFIPQEQVYGNGGAIQMNNSFDVFG